MAVNGRQRMRKRAGKKTEGVHMPVRSSGYKEADQALGATDFLVDDLSAGAMTLGTAIIRDVGLRCGSGVVSGLGDFKFPFLLTPEPYGYFPGGFSLKRSVGMQLCGWSCIHQ